MTKRTAARGTTIFTKGDVCSDLMAVLSGCVKITAVSTAGREVVFNLVHAGDIFGELALFDGGLPTADAVALSDCELIALNARHFRPFLVMHPHAAFKVIDLLCRRLRHVSEQLEDIMFLPLPCRLAKTLLHLADRGVLGDLTQREIGQIIGLSREGTNKQLRVWARYKWIKLDHGAIAVLDRDALVAAAVECPEI